MSRATEVVPRRTSQVAPKHQVENKEAVLIVLERIPHVDNEWMVNLRIGIRSGILGRL